MISARSEACPQGLLGSGIRELIRTLYCPWTCFSSAVKHKCIETFDCCLALLLKLYKSFAAPFAVNISKFKKNHQSVKFHLKSASLQLYFTDLSNKSKDEKCTERT